MLTLYHGSDHIITAPTLNLARPHNDYGPGFYCTRSLNLAKEWACKDLRDGYANQYRLDENGLQVLDLCTTEYSVLNWIALLLNNRTLTLRHAIDQAARDYLLAAFLPDTSSVDLVIGPRADDSYFSYATSFVANGIPVRALDEALRLGDLGIQYVLISQKAFDALTFEDAIPAYRAQYYPQFLQRDQNAREDYAARVRQQGVLQDDLFVRDLIREEVAADDPRIPRMLPS